MELKISVIVPIYNVENYLERSIECLMNQTLKDLEIILVNDGSQDKSLDICKKYELLDSRIKVIDKLNGGVSSARNEGLKIASGSFIGFIDPDDWIEAEMYEQMYNKIIESKSQIAICDFWVEEVNKVPKEVKLNINSEILSNAAIQEYIIKNTISSPSLDSNMNPIMGSVCRLLINKEILDKNNIFFDEKIHLMEDLLFVLEIMLKCEKLVTINKSFYHYMLRGNSAVTSYRKNFLGENMEVYSKVEALVARNNIEYFRERLHIRYVTMYLHAFVNEIHGKNEKSIIQKIDEIKMMCKDKLLKDILSGIDCKKYTIRKKIILKSVEKERASFIFIYYLLMKLKLRLKH